MKVKIKSELDKRPCLKDLKRGDIFMYSDNTDNNLPKNVYMVARSIISGDTVCVHLQSGVIYTMSLLALAKVDIIKGEFIGEISNNKESYD